MIVLDTTVLVYAVGAEHPLRAPCRQVVTAVREHHLEATTTVEVLQEFTHVRARRRGSDDAAALAAEFADLLSPLLIVEEDDFRAGLAIYRQSTRLGAFDAVLAAVALAAGARALVSADAGFADVRTLRHVIPDVRAVEQLEKL
ncbi:MAG: type II toxin-antitoxin system VapC family toxin [Jiangellaceae bacterium]